MNFRFYRIGAWLWIMTGVIHTMSDISGRLFPSPAKEPIRATLRGLTFELVGMSNDYYNLIMGFSLAMGTSIALVGILFLMVARLVPGTPDRARSARFVGLVGSLGLFALAITVLQLPPPIITFALASLAFAAALLAPTQVTISRA